MAKKRSERTRGQNRESEDARMIMRSLLGGALDAEDATEFLAHVSDDSQIDFGEDEEGELPYPVFDRPMMAKLLKEIPPHSDSAQANWNLATELMDQLDDEFDPAHQLELAQDALRAAPYCADAWNYLAECADSPEHALELFQRAEQASRLMLGGRFDDLRGQFEDAAETQSVMRSLEGKADILQLMRRNEEAIDVYAEMLELSPGDPQGVRRRLLGLLLLLNRVEEATELLDDYPDEEFALWAYARLLLAIRADRQESELDALLADAHTANQHLIPYLVGDRRIEADLPEFFSMGDESEALVVAPELLPVWRTTPGATAWLRRAVARLGLEVESASDAEAGTRESLLIEAAAAPQDLDQVWQVDYRKGTSHDEVYWGVMIADPQDGLARHEVVLNSKPTPDDVFDAILEAIVQPDLATPGRPGEIHFAKKSLCKKLWKHLEPLSISCRVEDVDELDQIFDFVAQMAEAEVDPQAEDPISIEARPGSMWQVAAVQMLDTIEEQGERLRPWVAVVFEPETGLILQIDVSTTLHTAEGLCNVIRKAIFCSPYGEPTRPEEVQVRSNDDLLAMEPLLAPWQIRCRLGPSFEDFDSVVNDMQSRFANQRLPSICDIPGITAQDLCFYYEAAAEFYKVAPWIRTRPDHVLKLSSPDFDRPVFVVIMGQLGSVIGLALFSELDDIQRLLAAGPRSDPTQFRQSSWSVIFGEVDDISPQDADALEVHGWPVAAPEAFPALLRVDAGRPMATTDPRELRLIAECLATLARTRFPVTTNQLINISLPETVSGQVLQTDVAVQAIDPGT